MEFEAHSFADIANALYAGKYSERGSNLLNTDSSPELINAVSDLMNSIIKTSALATSNIRFMKKQVNYGRQVAIQVASIPRFSP